MRRDGMSDGQRRRANRYADGYRAGSPRGTWLARPGAVRNTLGMTSVEVIVVATLISVLYLYLRHPKRHCPARRHPTAPWQTMV